MSNPPREMSTSNSITSVMVAHGRSAVVAQTLRGLADCEQPASYERMILVENGPPCGMAEAIAPFRERLRITHETASSPKKTVALNHALQWIGTGWALFIDDDVRVSPDWIRCYAEAISHERQGHYFGGPTSVDYEQRPPEWLIPYLPESAKGLAFPPSQTEIRYPLCFLGFNWAARVEALLQAGGFSEDFGPGTPLGGGDESFMQRQLSLAGQRGRVIPEALVWHQIPPDRCSAEWCLKRFFAGGQTVGIEAAWGERKRPRRLGSLRCYLRHLRNRVLSMPVGDVLRMSAPGRFWVQRTLHWMQGFSAGYRQAMNDGPASSPSPSPLSSDVLPVESSVCS